MENKIEIPPFYVGQEVVVVKNHSKMIIKKGQEFTITSIRKSCCTWLVTVGLLSIGGFSRCVFCKRLEPAGEEFRFNHTMFSPKIEIREFISMKQLAEQQLEVIGAN